MDLYYSENLKKIDAESYSVFGYSEDVLMENAGSGCYREILSLYGKTRLQRSAITVICGKGNNGGDGFVISRYLFNAGFNVKTVILAYGGSYSGAAERNMDILSSIGADIAEIAEESSLPALASILDKTSIIVDAIFGVGLNRETNGFFKAAIDAVNGVCAERPELDVLCVDVPSGLNADTGMYMGSGIERNVGRIFTFGGPKVGFYINDGEKRLMAEKISVIDISHPRGLLKKHGPGIEAIDESEIAGYFTGRKRTGTKFDYGHLLVVAGSNGKSGAAYMASYAGFKGGAGLVTAAVPAKLNAVMEAKTTEIMTYPAEDAGNGFFIEKSASDISGNILKGKTAVVAGPGIGLNAATKAFLRRFITGVKVPLVLDADALNILSEDTGLLKDAADKTDIVLTPHFKEMERLTGIDRKDIESDPLNFGRDFVRKFGVYLVLKGSSMFIFDKNGKNIYIQGRHSPLLASGGSGDILSGLIGSFICSGMDISAALKAAAFLTIYSSNLLECRYGDFGAGAVNIADNIPEAVESIKLKNKK